MKINTDNFFSLKVSGKEKHANDNQWFKTFWDINISSSFTETPDYERKKQCYEILNNNISTYKNLIKQYSSLTGEKSEAINVESILPYNNKIYTKVNVLAGDFLNMIQSNNKFIVVPLTSSAFKKKNELKKKHFKNALKEKLQNELEAENLNPLEKQTYLEENTTQPSPAEVIQQDFLTDWEVFMSHGVKLCLYSQDVAKKATDTWIDAVISNEAYTKVSIKHGMPVIDVINPLRVNYKKSPDQEFISKSEWFKYNTVMTKSELIDSLDLTEEELKELGTDSGLISNYDKRHNIFSKAEPIQNSLGAYEWSIYDANTVNTWSDRNTGLYQSNSTARYNSNSDLYWVSHVEFKAYDKIYFRISYNDDGDKDVKVFSEAYKIPKKAKKEKTTNVYGDVYTSYNWYDDELEQYFQLEEHWIPRAYEMFVIDGKIFKKCRQVPIQPLNMERPFSSFSLSYHGVLLEERNSNAVSIVERVIPIMFQIFYLKLIQNKEISKYKSFIHSVDVDQIPDDLGKDADGNYIQDPTIAWFRMLEDHNVSLYSGSQTSDDAIVTHTRTPGGQVFKLGSANEILALQNLISLLDREISYTMGISPQREAHFTQGVTASSDNEAIQRSYTMTKVYFEKTLNFWRRTINYWLELYRICIRERFENGETAQYMTYVTSEGNKVIFKITEDHLSYNDFGLWLSSSDSSSRYTETMMQLVHAFAQNAGEGIESVSRLVKLMTHNASASEIHAAIEEEANKRAKRLKEMQEAQSKAQKELVEQQNILREDHQKHEIEKIVVKEIERRKTEMMKSEVSLEEKQLELDHKTYEHHNKIELENQKINNGKQ